MSDLEESTIEEGEGGETLDDSIKPFESMEAVHYLTTNIGSAKKRHASLKAFNSYLTYARQMGRVWIDKEDKRQHFPESFDAANEEFLTRYLTYSEFITFLAFTFEYDKKGSTYKFGTIKGYAFICYGLAGGYREGGRYSNNPFFKTDRDSNKPVVINKFLEIIRTEIANDAAKRGEDVS